MSVEPDFPYLVTAKHVIETVARFPEDTYIIRFNPQPYMRSMQGYEHQDMEMRKLTRWYTHPDDSNVDIAVLPLAHLSPRLLAQVCIPTSMFFLYEQKPTTYTPEEAQVAFLEATKNSIQGQNRQSQAEKQPMIAIGDETYTVGLYSLVPGRNDNVPVVRVGNIAMMPGEPIHCLDDVERELYLIEMRSIGGLSGSPVFSLSPITNTYWLLGMIHGHHTLKEMETTLHTGMALVTPIQKLLEILEQSELVELRQMETATRQASLEMMHRQKE